LAAIYNPKHPQFFNAYMIGSPHKDLRVLCEAPGRRHPANRFAEEVGLINYNGGGMDDGIWYSEHLVSN